MQTLKPFHDIWRCALGFALACALTGALADTPAPAVPTKAQAPHAMHCPHHGGASFRAAFEAEQQALHDALALTPAQEPSWAVFRQSFAPPEQPRRAQPPRAEGRMSAVARLETLLARHQAHGKALEQRLQVLKTFYDGLTPEQQQVFDTRFIPHPRGMRCGGPGKRRGGEHAPQ